MIPGSHPILSCDEARDFEAKLFAGDEEKEWSAMQRAGRAIAAAVLQDFQEIGRFPAEARLLVLVGKGHNGGDALIAAEFILARCDDATADLQFAFNEQSLRPLAQRAWRTLLQRFPERVRAVRQQQWHASYDLCLDGVFGFQFRPPASAGVLKLLHAANRWPIRLRAAVDLPSANEFRADFTYATGSVKAPILEGVPAGRIRYLDLGFFGADAPGNERVLTSGVLGSRGGFRPTQSDKRTFGHLFVVAGSKNYPGAALMAVLAALRSGVGLVTGCVPESMVPAFAARVPEAIWVGWPETTDGGLALEGLHLLQERMDRASAYVIGPGIGRERETHALVSEILKHVQGPVLLDADALRPEVLSAAKTPLVLTPHAGEFERIAGNASPAEFASKNGSVLVLKGPHTRVAAAGYTYHSFFGGPVLARGGSGDLLAGLIGGLLAQSPSTPALTAVQGVVWHGLAADLLARTHGQVAVHTTQLLDFLAAALREA